MFSDVTLVQIVTRGSFPEAENFECLGYLRKTLPWIKKPLNFEKTILFVKINQFLFADIMLSISEIRKNPMVLRKYCEKRLRTTQI